MGISKGLSGAKARIMSVSRKRLTVIAACIVITVIVIVIVGIRGCTGENASGDGDATCSTSVVAQRPQEGNADSATSVGTTSSNQNPDFAGTTAASDNDTDRGGDLSSPAATSSSASDAASGGQSSDVSTGSSASDGSSSGGSATDSGNASDAAPSKTWVIDYTQIWVEDSPGWTEQVPVYGYEEHSICNVCNADITGTDIVAHAKAHMLAGEGGGHHTEMVQVTGYETEYHEATGHYETVESGGHWE